MRIAIIGSRSLSIEDFGAYVGADDEIITGGARGIDSCASKFASDNKIPCTEILPDYKRYGRSAPIIRNKEIVELCDKVIAFWDGRSRGTAFVISYAKAIGRECEVIEISSDINPDN